MFQALTYYIFMSYNVKNYEMYNNERKDQVFASNSKFQKKSNRLQVTDNKSQIENIKCHFCKSFF